MPSGPISHRRDANEIRACLDTFSASGGIPGIRAGSRLTRSVPERASCGRHRWPHRRRGGPSSPHGGHRRSSGRRRDRRNHAGRRRNGGNERTTRRCRGGRQHRRHLDGGHRRQHRARRAHGRSRDRWRRGRRLGQARLGGRQRRRWSNTSRPREFEKNVRVNDDSGSGMHTDRPRILCWIGSKGLRRLNIHSIEAQVGPLSRVSGSVLCVARSLRAFSLVMTPCHRRDSVPLATSSLSPSRWLRSRMPPVCRAPRPSRERAAVAPRPVVCQEAAPVAEASLGVEAPSGAAVSWGAAAPAGVGRGPPAPAA